MTKLDEPACRLGYPWEQVERILGGSAARFSEWMSSQTVALCQGEVYNYDKKAYEPSGCDRPHGTVVYAHDLRRYLAKQPIID